MRLGLACATGEANAQRSRLGLAHRMLHGGQGGVAGGFGQGRAHSGQATSTRGSAVGLGRSRAGGCGRREGWAAGRSSRPGLRLHGRRGGNAFQSSMHSGSDLSSACQDSGLRCPYAARLAGNRMGNAARSLSRLFVEGDIESLLADSATSVRSLNPFGFRPSEAVAAICPRASEVVGGSLRCDAFDSILSLNRPSPVTVPQGWPVVATRPTVQPPAEPHPALLHQPPRGPT